MIKWQPLKYYDTHTLYNSIRGRRNGITVKYLDLLDTKLKNSKCKNVNHNEGVLVNVIWVLEIIFDYK